MSDPRPTTAPPRAPSSPVMLAPLGEGGELVPDVRRIAVLRGGGLGDLLFAMPALEALRAAYPRAEIVLLGPAWAASFLATRPSPIDRVMPLPVLPGINEPAGWADDREDRRDFVDAAVAERFDLAIQMHGGGRNSNPFVRRLRARLAVGLQAPDAPPLDRNVPYVYYQHEVLRDLAVVGLVGAAPVALEPRIAVTDEDLDAARIVCRSRSAPLAVLHPGAGDSRRRWPPEKFAAVGDALLDAGADVAVTGSPVETDLTRAVADGIHGEAQDLGGRLSLSALAGLLAGAAVVVSNDSGPLHLAAAAGAPTVGIYWCGNLVNAGPLSVARHRPAISWRLDCPECGIDCTKAGCEHRGSFVADVPVDDVRDPALELLGAFGHASRGRSASGRTRPASPRGNRRRLGADADANVA